MNTFLKHQTRWWKWYTTREASLARASQVLKGRSSHSTLQQEGNQSGKIETGEAVDQLSPEDRKYFDGVKREWATRPQHWRDKHSRYIAEHHAAYAEEFLRTLNENDGSTA